MKFRIVSFPTLEDHRLLILCAIEIKLCHAIHNQQIIRTVKIWPVLSDMASNVMSRIENQDGTCLVQILLSHTFLP